MCAVDTQTPALALQSLLHSMRRIDFGRVILFTHQWLPPVVLPRIEIIDIGPLHGAHEHSAFVMRQLPAYVRTSHALLTRWDGFISNPAAWDDSFLVYDYIGAAWPGEPDDSAVGEGGFSLRSRRYLVAGQDARITQVHPEDEVLCRHHRAHLESVHGVIFAPLALAQRFVAYEPDAPAGNGASGPSGASRASLGFRGAHHLPGLLGEVELSRWLDELPAAYFAGNDAPRLLRALLAGRMTAAAAKLVARRKSAGADGAERAVLGAATR